MERKEIDEVLRILANSDIENDEYLVIKNILVTSTTITTNGEGENDIN